MPNPDPSPETRFHKGRAKTGGRQKGTPNKPITVKLAMRTFTNERGAELMAFAERVLFELSRPFPCQTVGFFLIVLGGLPRPCHGVLGRRGICSTLLTASR